MRSVKNQKEKSKKKGTEKGLHGKGRTLPTVQQRSPRQSHEAKGFRSQWAEGSREGSYLDTEKGKKEIGGEINELRERIA